MNLDLNLAEIIKAVDGEIIVKNNEGIFNKISTDTRKIQKDNLFIALKGENLMVMIIQYKLSKKGHL